MAINPLQQPIDYTAQMPDISRQFAGFNVALGELGERRRQEQAAQQAEQKAQAAQAEFAKDMEAAIKSGRAEDFARIAIKYPGMQNVIKDTRESLGEERIKNEFDTGARISMLFENDQPELAREQIQTIIEAGRNSGQPVGTYESIAELYDAGNVAGAQAATNFALMMLDPPKMTTFVEAAAKQAEAARDREMFPTIRAKEEAELAKAQSDAERAAIEAEYRARYEEARIAKAGRAGVEAAGPNLHSSKTLDDGTVVNVFKDGTITVTDPTGQEVFGEDRARVIREAQQFGVETTGQRAGGREAAVIGQRQANKAFDQISAINRNLSNLDRAITLIDEGANTGAIESRLPSWKASTVELKNIQNQLGLDVVGSVTFGALSESELALALNTALPTNLNSADLRKWLVSKKEAQTKLSDYLTEQTRFLSVPGRSVGDWLDFKQTQMADQAIPKETEIQGQPSATGVDTTNPLLQ